MSKPTKQEVRDWQKNRNAAHEPPPSPEQIRRELGWHIEEARRKEQEKYKNNAK